MYWILHVLVIVEFFLYKFVSDDALLWLEVFPVCAEDTSVEWYWWEKGKRHRSEARRLGADGGRYREKTVESAHCSSGSRESWMR
jgi:hypothetical protein